MKTLFLVSVAISVSFAASSSRAEVAPRQPEMKTGRSVAVDAPRPYWLSSDLNRLFLQKPGDAAGADAAGDDKASR